MTAILLMLLKGKAISSGVDLELARHSFHSNAFKRESRLATLS